MKRLAVTISLALLFIASQAEAYSKRHPDPLEAMSAKKHHRKKARHKRKKRHKYRASKRSLRSYSRMKSRYHGKLYDNPAFVNPVDVDIYTKHQLTDEPYLELKAIDGPMPQDYIASYLKLKTLLNPASQQIKIVVDKSKQRMFIYRDMSHIYTFKTSTGKAGHGTPNGTFSPKSIERMHYSRKYYNSPMPWSVFYYKGFAIHGTSAISKLGRPASHGCVRTHPSSARVVYDLVRKYGKKNTTIIVQN